MKEKIKIILGSTSKHKLAAIEEACKRIGLAADVSGIKTNTGLNEQPVDLAETFEGALLRAQAAKAASPQGVAVGIENGIFRTNNEKLPLTIDLAVIVVLSKDGRRIIATTPGIAFPEDCVETAKQRGFATTTTGSVIAEKFGGDHTDPHSTLTHGAVSRLQTLVDGLVMALSQL
ncbi:MAG: DUF84 family protein [Candidatus Pacebacteria bacterium]|nr:DUF84 family protein [Candidatus Paceibacterota bacterium]